MKTKIKYNITWFFIITILFVGNSCKYNNIPTKINTLNKNAQKQGIWLESNIEQDEERIILQYYRNGVLNGDYREFFPDGTLGVKGKFKNGDPVGKWKFYLENGTLISWRIYDKNGKELEVGRVNPIW
ncbi:MAG: hypothetical protein R2792_20035 [Saprospiraceae bacterium]